MLTLSRQAVVPVVHTLLVVDAKAMMRELVARILEAEGYNVLTACSGHEALTLVRASVGGSR